jgi:nitrate reductase gamma subunit
MTHTMLALLLTMLTMLTGCAAVTNLSNTTLDARQAAHDAFLAQAAMTLRHATDLMNLENSAAAIQPKPATSAVTP